MKKRDENKKSKTRREERGRNEEYGWKNGVQSRHECSRIKIVAGSLTLVKLCSGINWKGIVKTLFWFFKSKYCIIYFWRIRIGYIIHILRECVYTFEDSVVLSKASRTLRKDENGEPIKSNIPNEFGQEEALRILIGAIKKGQSKGVYDIDTASALSKAVRTFVIKEAPSSTQETSKLETIVEDNEDNEDGTIVI